MICEFCSRVPERRHAFTHCSNVSIIDFKQVNTGWAKMT